MAECDFGRYLQRIRHQCCLTQDQLAELSGLSARCISDLERGINASPRAVTVGRLCDALKLDSHGRQQMINVAVCARDRVYGRELGPNHETDGTLTLFPADVTNRGKLRA